MGWKRYFYLGQSEFKSMYDRAQAWGALTPCQVIAGPATYYGQGIVSNQPTAQTGAEWRLSPKITHYAGYRTRITIKYVFYADAGVTGKADIGVVFYKDSDTCKNQTGSDIHGVGHTLSQAPASNLAEFHTMVIEQQNNTISLKVDDVDRGSWTLESPLNTFVIGIDIESVSGGNIGIVVYEVSVEYYDVMEDIINQISQMFNMMLWIFIPVMIIMLIISVFRKPKEEAR